MQPNEAASRPARRAATGAGAAGPHARPLEGAPQIEQALENPVAFKSSLQELLAQRGAEVRYAVTGEEGPPHDRTYTVAVTADGRELGCGRGKSKKQAEQEAARVAVEGLQG